MGGRFFSLAGFTLPHVILPLVISRFKALCVAAALLLPSAQALTLSVTSSLGVPGPADLRGAAWLPEGRKAICLGARVLVLGSDQVPVRSISTGAECLNLVLSPRGKLAALALGGAAGGIGIWQLEDGKLVKRLPLANAVDRFGFRTEEELLIGGPDGLEVLNLQTGDKTSLSRDPVDRLYVAPDGLRALIGSAALAKGKVQFISTQDGSVLSAMPCDAACPLSHTVFGVNGKTVVAQAGEALYAFREGFASTVIVRQTAQASGLPLRDGTVLTLNDGAVESRDLLIGRREKTYPFTGVQPFPAQLSVAERVLAVSQKGELLDADATFGDVIRLQLPARALGGGLDPVNGAPVVRLGAGAAVNGTRPLNGTFWEVQTMNKSTWVLTTGADGGLNLNLLSGGALKKMPGLRTATHLSVNHWGNHAAVWDDETLLVVSQAKNKVIATLKPPAGSLVGAQVTVSPDATRVFVFPGRGDAFVALLPSGKRFPVPFQAAPAGTRSVGVQVSGKGVMALQNSAGTAALYRPGEKKPYASVAAGSALAGQGARFSPSSALLALPASDERGPRVDLLNVDTGKVAASTPTLSAAPTFLAWNADSTRFVAGAGLMNDLNSVTVFSVAK